MQVQVRLFASLRDRLPRAQRGRAVLDVEAGASLLDLLRRLEIPDRQAPMVLVNGSPAPRAPADRAGHVLAEGDSVSIFPPLAGG